MTEYKAEHNAAIREKAIPIKSIFAEPLPNENP